MPQHSSIPWCSSSPEPTPKPHPAIYSPSHSATPSNIPKPLPHTSPRPPFPTAKDILSHLTCLNNHKPLTPAKLMSNLHMSPAVPELVMQIVHSSTPKAATVTLNIEQVPVNPTPLTASIPHLAQTLTFIGDILAVTLITPHPTRNNPRLTDIQCLIPAQDQTIFADAQCLVWLNL